MARELDQPEICIIAAVAQNGVIGRDGKLPWTVINGEQLHFKEVTTPHPVIMGRKTWDSIDEKYKPLVGRTNIVVTRQPDLLTPTDDDNDDVWFCGSLEGALFIAGRFGTVRNFIIGGAEIYRQSIDRADRLFLTLLERDYQGDTFFPDYSAFGKVVSEEQHETAKGLKYRFLELVK